MRSIHLPEDFLAAGKLDDRNGLDGVVVFVEGVRSGDALDALHALDGLDDSLLILLRTGTQALFLCGLQGLQGSDDQHRKQRP